MKKALYLGWVGYNNLGDELMFHLFKEQFSAFQNSYQLESANVEYRFLKNVPFHEYDLIILGGGSIFGGANQLVQPYIIQILYNCLLLNKKVMIWGTGIDWAPKSYIEKIKKNEELPLTISLSYKEKVSTVFEKSIWAGVRGPLTKKILQLYGVEECLISGDPAFLLTPPHMKEKKTFNKMIGVNWGTSFNNIYGGNELKVEDELVDALNQLIDKGYTVYLFTMWHADLPSIKQLYLKLKNPQKVILDSKLYDHNELMKLMKQFDFTINFKLHANYLSLAANIPFIALGYRFKVFDFVKSVQMEDYIIGTDEENISDKILKLENIIVQNETSIKNSMLEQVNFYRKRISEPFENKNILFPN